MKALLFFQNMDKERKHVMTLSFALLLMVIAVFLMFSIVSYIFTWDIDQSLIQNSENLGDVGNYGGVQGAIIADWLVADLFGLSALIIPLVIALFSLRAFSIISSLRVLYTLVMSMSFLLCSSWTLAYISIVLGLQSFLNGRLGGASSEVLVNWLIHMFGSFPTFFFLLALLLVLLIFFDKSVLHRLKEYVSSLLSKLVRKNAEKTDASSECPIEQAVSHEETFNEQEPSELKSELRGEAHKKLSAKNEVIVLPERLDEWGSENAQDDKNTSSPTKIVDSLDEAIRNEDSGKDNIEEQRIVSTEKESSFDVIKSKDFNDVNIKDLPHIDNRDELSAYEFPSIDLLEDYKDKIYEISDEELNANNLKIKNALAEYNIAINKVVASVGPTVTLYKVYPAAGVKVASIKNRHQDLAMKLKTDNLRISMLNDSIGLEVPNAKASLVPFKSILTDPNFINSKYNLPIALGYTISQKVKVFDLIDAPHLLVAGATKMGKSVGLNVIIASLLYTKHPSELKFVFIDPKKVEFTPYALLLKHYLAVLPVAASDEDQMQRAITYDGKPALDILSSLCVEMDARFELLQAAGVNNLEKYNEKYKNRYLLPTEGHKYLPYLVVVIDEYADLIMNPGANSDAKNISKGINVSIIRLAQKGRAAGIHVILATQRPSVDVIDGLIKANFPTRIAFRVQSSVDSKTILDTTGAEKLIGRGDMLFSANSYVERVQCAYISGEEIHNITEFIEKQKGYKKSYNNPYYLPAPETEEFDEGLANVDMKNLDARFEEAAKLVVINQRGSTSDLQRRLGIGYPKAGLIMDQLQAAGIVGPQEGSKPREVLVADLQELDAVITPFLKQNKY